MNMRFLQRVNEMGSVERVLQTKELLPIHRRPVGTFGKANDDDRYEWVDVPCVVEKVEPRWQTGILNPPPYLQGK